MDFESESNLHVYGEKLCLVQIYDGEKYFIVDPFKISRDELAKLFEDKKIVKYFYGCESDLSLVYKQFGIRIKSVLDLKNMVDVLGLEKRGLDAAIFDILNKTLNDKKHYQMFNWTIRPINKEALEYALSDVEYLFDLYRGLMKRIVELNKYDELIHALIRSRNEFDGKSTPTVFKSNEYRLLNNAEKEHFKRIYELRDGYAQELNFPPNVVISKEFLFKLAKRAIAAEAIAFEKKIPEEYRRKIIGSLKDV
jgi:ribonuclease D